MKKRPESEEPETENGNTNREQDPKKRRGIPGANANKDGPPNAKEAPIRKSIPGTNKMGPS